MILHEILNLIKHGFVIVNKFDNDKDIVRVTVAKLDDDGVVLTSEFGIIPANFTNDTIYIQVLQETTSKLDYWKINRKYKKVEDCKHEYIDVKDGKYVRIKCAHCRGSFGIKNTQEVTLSLN